MATGPPDPTGNCTIPCMAAPAPTEPPIDSTKSGDPKPERRSSIHLLNIQGMSTKATSSSRWKLPVLAESLLNNPDYFVPFMCITESWLKTYLTDAQIKVENYTPFRADRDTRIEGGALIYTHNSYITSNKFTYDDQTCEAVAIQIDTIKTIAVCIYRPPDATYSSFKKLLSKLQVYLDEVDPTYSRYVTGDFNLPGIDWDALTNPTSRNTTNCANLLMNFSQENFLTQVVDVHTRGTATLDLILVSNTTEISEVSSHDTNLSDHKIVEAHLLFDAQHPMPERKPPEFNPHSFRALDFHVADTKLLDDSLNDINWKELFQSCKEIYGDDCLDEYAELTRLTVLQVAIQLIPSKKAPATSNKPSRHRHVLYRKRRKLNARLKAFKHHQPTSPVIPKLQAQLNLLEYQIRDHVNHELDLREQKAISKMTANPRYFFSYAKRFSKLKSNVGPLKDADGTLHHHPNKMADLLQDQYSAVFSNPLAEGLDSDCTEVPEVESVLTDIPITEKDMADAMNELDPYSSAPEGDIPAKILKDCRAALCTPLTILWQHSFSSGRIPDQFKWQFIAPIFKKDDKTDPANYRPVSLTSHVIKIFERVVRKYLVQYLEDNNLITERQHGFRKGRSCLTQLLSHIENILQHHLQGSETDIIYLDYAKAFDKVDHSLLIKKLFRYGIQGNLYTWLTQFLRGRQQVVLVDGEPSRPAPVLSGVPQGTVLGPVLFLLYINEIPSVLQHSTCGSFADDTRITKAIANVADTQYLQADLNNVVSWSAQNNMKLHEKKFELVSYRNSSSKYLRELPFADEFSQYLTPAGYLLQPQPLVKDLGVILSSDLSWTPHINKIVTDARKMAAWVLGVFKDRSRQSMLQLYKSMVRCRLEYCSPVWSPSLLSDIQALEDVQRFFTKKIRECKDLDYHQRLKKLDLQSLQRRRERYCIIHIWKIYHGITPNDLNIKFATHARLGVKTLIPPINKQASQAARSRYDASFSVNAARLWNTLPKGVNTVDKLDLFKTKLGNHLNEIPDTPPATGLTVLNDNSIVSWHKSGSGGLRKMWRP